MKNPTTNAENALKQAWAYYQEHHGKLTASTYIHLSIAEAVVSAILAVAGALRGSRES